MTGLDPEASRSPDRTRVRYAGREPPQRAMVTGSRASIAKAAQERLEIAMYCTKSGPDTPLSAICANIPGTGRGHPGDVGGSRA